MKNEISNTEESSNGVKADVIGSKNLCGWVSVAERMPECGRYIASYYNPSDSSKKLKDRIYLDGETWNYDDFADTFINQEIIETYEIYGK